MRIDSGESASIVAADYSPNVALFCGRSRNGRFSRYIYDDFISDTMYEREGIVDYNKMFNEIKRK